MDTERMGARAMVEAYDPGFRATMLVAPDAVGSVAALRAALADVPSASRALAEALLLGVGAGQPVPERFRDAIEAHGTPLWRAAVLLPRGTPSRGATIDPLYYAAFCRLNPALSRLRLLRDVHRADDTPAHPPATDAMWDAAVIAARLEADPPRLTQAGALRKDDRRRLVTALGGDATRWLLALEVAKAIGLARPAAGALHGFPESRARPLVDPTALLDAGGRRRAGALLLRIAGPHWLDLDALVAHLGVRCPAVLDEPGGDFEGREGRWIRDAAARLHRLGALDGQRGVDGITAVRARSPRLPRPPGFLLTPDRDVLVGPGELPLPEYGRLCRLAPYQDGDVVHRHRLQRAGIAADLAAGHEDALAFLGARSRTGVPGPVRDTLTGWARAASRVTLLTGATLIERDGVFTVLDGPPPDGARVLSYEERPVARMIVRGGEVEVPFGWDPLSVRALAARLGPALPTRTTAWRWQLAPAPASDVDSLLAALAAVHDGPLPGELEASVRAAGGVLPIQMSAAVRVSLPPDAAPALMRDRVLRPLLQSAHAAPEAFIRPSDIPAVLARLRALGFPVEEAEGPWVGPALPPTGRES